MTPAVCIADGALSARQSLAERVGSIGLRPVRCARGEAFLAACERGWAGHGKVSIAVRAAKGGRNRTRRTSLARGAILGAALASCAVPAPADTVRLANGDRITGTVVRKAGDELVVRTEYAGELKIRWGDVVEVLTDAPATVLLDDGHSVSATHLGSTGAVALDHIAFVNPTPGQAGTGIDYSGRVTLAATVTGGNTRTDRYYGEAQLRGRSAARRFSLGGNATEASDGGKTTASNWRLNADHDWFLRPRHFTYLRGSMEHDVFRDLDLRSALGGGYGYQILDGEEARLSVQGGLDYLDTNRAEGPDEGSLALGWGVRYSQWLWARRAQAFHEQDGFYGLEQSDFVLRTRTGLHMPLVDRLNLTAQLNLDWDSDPAPGRRTTDTTWLLGLGYAW